MYPSEFSPSSNYPTYSTCPFIDSRPSDHTHIPSTPSTPPTQRGRSKSQINETINIPPSWGSQQVRAAASPYTCIHVYSTRQCVCTYLYMHSRTLCWTFSLLIRPFSKKLSKVHMYILYIHRRASDLWSLPSPYAAEWVAPCPG